MANLSLAMLTHIVYTVSDSEPGFFFNDHNKFYKNLHFLQFIIILKEI